MAGVKSSRRAASRAGFLAAVFFFAAVFFAAVLRFGLGEVFEVSDMGTNMVRRPGIWKGRKKGFNRMQFAASVGAMTDSPTPETSLQPLIDADDLVTANAMRASASFWTPSPNSAKSSRTATATSYQAVRK